MEESTITYAGNTYAGEVLENLLVYTAQGNDTYDEGLIHIKPGLQKRFTLPHVKLGKIIQDNKPTPTSNEGKAGADGANAFTLSERYLEPHDFMVYLEFNPRAFERFWRPFQPTGPLVFRELDPSVQAKMLELLIDKKDQYINDAIWSSKLGGADGEIVSDNDSNIVIGGDAEAGPMKYFNGFMARAVENLNSTDPNEVASGKMILAGNTVLDTGEKVEAALSAMYKACPKRLRKSKKIKFVMDFDLWDLYDQYLSSKSMKYAENTEVNQYKFKGKRIVPINGMPEQTIALGKFTTDEDSCLWMGIDYDTDQESVKVDRLQNNSELYFFQMRMKIDVNIVKPGEIVLWSTYKKAPKDGE